MESKYKGYMGKVMLVDLTTETATEYPWSDEERELYLGGKIMAARILCDHLTGKEKPFSEENWIVISTGPLSGTGAPSSARFNIASPFGAIAQYPPKNAKDEPKNAGTFPFAKK